VLEKDLMLQEQEG